MQLAINMQYCFCFYMILGSVHQYRYYVLFLLPRFFFHSSFFISLVQNIYTNSFSITILPFSSICFPSFIFNIFDVLKPSISKRFIATFPSRTSKKRYLVRQPPLASQQLRLVQFALSFELSSLVRVLYDIYLVYEIYLISKFLAHCYLRMLCLIIVWFMKLDLQDTQVSVPVM